MVEEAKPLIIEEGKAQGIAQGIAEEKAKQPRMQSSVL